MRIDIHNYEEFVLDFLEGNLSEQQTEEMKAFLLMHPHIAEDLEELDEVVLEAESQSLLEKNFTNQLKKTEIKTVASISEDNYEEVLIAELEQDLNAKEKHDLEKFILQNPEIKIEQALVLSLKVIADKEVVFDKKSSLKKKDRPVIALWTIASSVAAVFLLSFWLSNLPSSDGRLPNFEPLQGIETASVHVNARTNQLQEKNEESIVSSLPIEIDEQIVSRPEIERLASLTSLEREISIEDQSWKNEMVLLKAYAFHKNQLTTLVDLADFPAINRSGPVKLISSMLWKTTKASVKSFSDELIGDEMKLLSSNNIGDITGGRLRVKRPSKEVE